MKFRAVVTNISIVDMAWREKMVRVDLTEEREMPSPIVVPSNQSDLARELAPVVTQMLRAIPLFGSEGKARLPRLSLYLSEEEWDRLMTKPTIGDVIEVEVTEKSVRIQRE